MFGVWLVCCGLLAGDGEVNAPAADVMQAYQAAKAEARRDADAHVRLAIWCGEHGLTKEREKHLGIAVMLNPRHAQARELLGLTNSQEPAASAVPPPAPAPDPAPPSPEDAAQVAALAEYNARNEKLQNTADAHWQMALWCEQKGLKAEALVHLGMVVQLDPSREAAWKRMGYKKHNGRWMTDEQIALEKTEAAAQRKADRHWKPLLEKWRGWLGNPAKKGEAETALADVTDARAVPSIWQVFGAAGAELQVRAVQLLGQIKSPGSSRMLAVLAVSGKSDEVRHRATEVLRGRDAMEFVDLWIALLRDPLKYEVRPVGGPGSPGAIFVEGKEFNVQRLYAPPSLLQTMAYYESPAVSHPALPLVFGSSVQRGPPPGSIRVGTGPTGLGLYVRDEFRTPQPRPVPQVNTPPEPSLGYQNMEQATFQQMILADWLVSETQKMAIGSMMSQKSDVETIENFNATVRQTNDRVSAALAGITGENLGADREAWTEWWKKQRGYAYQSPKDKTKTKATLLLSVPLPYAPLNGPPIVIRGGSGGMGPDSGFCMLFDHHRGKNGKGEVFASGSCFAAGTPVQTPTGARPIEALRAGDVVVSQSGPGESSGWAVIEAIHATDSSPALRLKIGDELLLVTPGHPIWRADKGWTKAGELRPGDFVRTLAGEARVVAVEPGECVPVFNLRLRGDGHTFYVGREAALVHDDAPFAPAASGPIAE